MSSNEGASLPRRYQRAQSVCSGRESDVCKPNLLQEVRHPPLCHELTPFHLQNVAREKVKPLEVSVLLGGQACLWFHLSITGHPHIGDQNTCGFERQVKLLVQL